LLVGIFMSNVTFWSALVSQIAVLLPPNNQPCCCSQVRLNKLNFPDGKCVTSVSFV
jgi:hypothetical protein